MDKQTKKMKFCKKKNCPELENSIFVSVKQNWCYCYLLFFSSANFRYSSTCFTHLQTGDLILTSCMRFSPHCWFMVLFRPITNSSIHSTKYKTKILKYIFIKHTVFSVIQVMFFYHLKFTCIPKKNKKVNCLVSKGHLLYNECNIFLFCSEPLNLKDLLWSEGIWNTFF